MDTHDSHARRLDPHRNPERLENFRKNIDLLKQAHEAVQVWGAADVATGLLAAIGRLSIYADQEELKPIAPECQATPAVCLEALAQQLMATIGDCILPFSAQADVIRQASSILHEAAEDSATSELTATEQAARDIVALAGGTANQTIGFPDQVLAIIKNVSGSRPKVIEYKGQHYVINKVSRDLAVSMASGSEGEPLIG